MRRRDRPNDMDIRWKGRGNQRKNYGNSEGNVTRESDGKAMSNFETNSSYLCI